MQPVGVDAVAHEAGLARDLAQVVQVQAGADHWAVMFLLQIPELQAGRAFPYPLRGESWGEGDDCAEPL